MSIINSNELYNSWIKHINKQNTYMQTGGSGIEILNQESFKTPMMKENITELNKYIVNIKANIIKFSDYIKNTDASKNELIAAKEDLQTTMNNQKLLLKKIDEELNAIAINEDK